MDPPPLLNGLSLGEGEVRDSITSMKKTSSSKNINKNSHQADTDHKSATASSLGNLKIAEVNGKFVRIINASPEEEEDIGGYILQQNVCGHPVSVYRFPPKIRITAGCAVTVWAATANAPHNPPSDFLWKELKTFITERRCTTILSNANGHAVAWYTPVRPKNCKSIEWHEVSEERPKTSPQMSKQRTWEWNLDADVEPVIHSMYPEQEKVAVLLRREKIPPHTLYPPSSPWTHSVSSPTHPDFSHSRLLALGNDGRSSCRQSRSQTAKTESAAAFSGTKSPNSRHGNRICRGPTRSAGPNSRGVLYLGSSAPAGSILHKYFANSSYDIRLASHGSLTPSILSTV
ncbi:Hypothetical predicted protein [Pelobates cultripes]|uniref:LTD domain-containing protein n=1 Tax=Pelobates cultripes TaxID=61616 RepID=A0AAD1RYF4_PELCU|nr:Hypothetical predicted protein [Pelobates cultripes]